MRYSPLSAKNLPSMCAFIIPEPKRQKAILTPRQSRNRPWLLFE